MTQIQRYLENTYCFSSQSQIIARWNDEYSEWFSLGENICHPQSGGQPADIGWVNDIPVQIRKHISGQVVIYPQQPVDAASDVILRSTLSVPDRLKNAALHTYRHLLNCELRQYGWMVRSGHYFPQESRVELSSIGSIARLFEYLPRAEIKESIEDKLRHGGKINAWMEGDTRIVLIKNTVPIACGGAYVDDINRVINFIIKSVKLKKGTLCISYDATHSALWNNRIS